MILRLLFVFSLIVRCLTDDPTSSSVGEDFLLAFFPHATETENVLHITSSSLGHCVIHFRDNFQSQMYVEIGNEQTTEVLIPDTAQVSRGAVVESKGVRISCSHPVSVHASYRSPSRLPSSVMVVLPVSSLSQKYFIPGFPGHGFVGIVSTRDNNTVITTLNTTCKYIHRTEHNSDQTITEDLSDADVLFLYGPDCDFAGAIVESVYPVAAFSGSIDIPNSGVDGTDDIASLQVLPLHMWGTQFVISEAIFSHNVTRKARILVSKDSTRLTKSADGQMKETLDNLKAGQYIEHALTADETYIYNSSSPVSITVLAFGSQGTTYLPSPSLNLYQRDALVPTFRTFETYLMITSKTEDLDNIQINNNTLSGKMWANVTSINLAYSVGILPMKGERYLDVSHISGRDVFSAQVYGRSLGEFAFNVGYGSYSPSPNVIDYWNSKVELSCGHDAWEITLNTAAFGNFSQIFEHLTLGDRCSGILVGQRVIFNVPLQDCGTEMEITGGKKIYKNYLAFHTIWRYNIICSPNIPAPLVKTGEVIDSYIQTIQSPIVHLNLFADIDYKRGISRVPLTVGRGETVYVDVSAPDSMGLTMVVTDCSVMSHILIYNRCAYDRTVSILLISHHVTRFSFRESGLFGGQIVDLRCDVHFCKTGDQSDQCQQKCPSYYGPAVGK